MVWLGKKWEKLGKWKKTWGKNRENLWTSDQSALIQHWFSLLDLKVSWKNGNPEKEIEDLEMCVHLFGSVSSPSCSNYALKRTSIDYQWKYGEDAGKTLRRNFYVDDMLKSSPDVVTTIDLLQRTRSLCEAGGFELPKFVSNNTEVIQSIQSTLVKQNSTF